MKGYAGPKILPVPSWRALVSVSPTLFLMIEVPLYRAVSYERGTPVSSPFRGGAPSPRSPPQLQTLSNVLEGFKNASRFRDETRSQYSPKHLATPEGNSQLGSNCPNYKAPEKPSPFRRGAPLPRSPPQFPPLNLRILVYLVIYDSG